jgi:hypothetical protein
MSLPSSPEEFMPYLEIVSLKIEGLNLETVYFEALRQEDTAIRVEISGKSFWKV